MAVYKSASEESVKMNPSSQLRSIGETLEIRCCRTITQIDVKSWDSLSGENVLASHGWLRLIEESLVVPVSPYYLTANASDGIVGATVCYHMQANPLFGNLDHIVFGRFKSLAGVLGLSLMPALICGSLYGYGAHLLVSKDLTKEVRDLVMSRLISALESLGREHGLSLAFPGIMEEEAEVVHQLKRRGFHGAEEIPVCILDLNFSDFEGYIGFIRSKRKKAANSIRREIKRSRRDGTRIRQLHELGGYGPGMHRMLDRQYRDYNGVPWMFDESFFGKAFAYLQEEVSFYIAERAERMTGCSVALQRGRTTYFLFLGIDREVTGKDFTYFNLMYHRIEDAISRGIRKVFFGRLKYEAKIRRGCHLERVFVFYKPKRALKSLFIRGWFPLLTHRNHHLVPEKYWHYWDLEK